MTIKELLKRVLKWVLDRIVNLLIWAAFIVLAGWGVKKGFLWFARRGKVDKPMNFAPVPGDPTKIMLRDDEEKKWKEVSLPSGVTSDKVKAAGFAEGDKIIKVEVAHEKVDRRSYTDPVNGSD